jgi:ribosomal protein S18 acetylase RimI-like enzyme
MALDLRLAGLSDAPAIHQVMAAAGAAVADDASYFVDDLAFVERHIEGQGFTLVASLDDDIVGFQIVRIPGVDDDNLGPEIGLSGADLLKVAHVESSAVRPDHWGEGIQRLLITRAEELLDDQGFRWFMCTVYPKNVYSLRNLQSLGYRIVSTKIKYGGYERHTMLKENNRSRPFSPGE